MKVGFTGRRDKLSLYQATAVYDILVHGFDGPTPERPVRVTELHHGDCVGADAYAAGIAFLHGVKTIAHPPSNPTYRAFTSGGEILPEKPYLKRNHDIVDACDVLVACPSGPETLRSGTWATVRYARKKHIPIVLLMP